MEKFYTTYFLLSFVKKCNSLVTNVIYCFAAYRKFARGLNSLQKARHGLMSNKENRVTLGFWQRFLHWLWLRNSLTGWFRQIKTLNTAIAEYSGMWCTGIPRFSRFSRFSRFFGFRFWDETWITTRTAYTEDNAMVWSSSFKENIFW